MVLFNQAIVKKSAFWIKHAGWDKAAGIFLLLIIALTYTRIAWIGAALFLAATGLIYFRRAVIWFVAGIIAFYVLFFPVNALLVDNFNFNLQSFGIIGRLTSRNEEADSIQWRADIANKVLPLWQERPLQGYGYGSFAKVWDDHKGVANLWDNTSEAHNDYLKVGFEDGIIGLILFLWIFADMIWRQYKYGRKNHWINIVFYSSLVVYLVLSASDNMLHHTPVIWWMWAVWGWWSKEYSE
jgi:O-antigen ligase